MPLVVSAWEGWKMNLSIRHEFLNSGISEAVLDLNIEIVDDIEIDSITKEVL